MRRVYTITTVVNEQAYPPNITLKSLIFRTPETQFQVRRVNSMYEGRFTAFHFYTSHKLSLNVCTSSPSSVPFLSWIKSNNVPPGAYSITIISDLSSTKLSKYAIMFGCFNLSRMSISFIAAFRSSFWSSSTVICLITIKLLSTFRLQRNTLLCVCVYKHE